MSRSACAAALLLLGLLAPQLASGARQAGKKQLGKERKAVTAEDDRVTKLPGWSGSTDGLYAGYVTVDDDADRALFYVFAESEGSATDPVVLWLNGGPGCSSLGGGLMSELGPWYPTPGGARLQANPYRWNRAAHVIFLESPAGVGFSYSKRAEDMVVGDARTAADSRQFLLRWYQRFPQFRSNPLYISGESYAGHYVPNLGLAIVKGNEASSDPRQHLPLAGLLVGNPWTDTAIDNLGAVDFWYYHALISDTSAMGIRANCNFSRIGPLDWHPEHANPTSRDQACDNFCNQATDELGPINIYQIYADVCLLDRPARSASDLASGALSLRQRPGRWGQAEALARALGDHPGALTFRAAVASLKSARAVALQRAPSRRALALAKRQQAEPVSEPDEEDQEDEDGDDEDAVPGYDPCVDDEVQVYLNRPEVQRALHANVSGDVPGPWSDCTNRIAYSREDLLSSMLPVYQQLLARESLRILIYSGDIDGIVPVVGTRRWVAGLGLKTHKSWRPWMSESKQVGGYWVQYAGGLTFSTVRAAGHMAPYVQPERSFYMFTKFLRGEDL